MFKIMRRLPKIDRLSIPKSGRTLLLNTRVWAEPILLAHQKLREALVNQIGSDACASIYRANYSFLNFASSRSVNSETIISLCSASLILNWISARSTGNISVEGTLWEAEKWYGGYGYELPMLSENLTDKFQDEVLAPLRDLNFGEHFLDILPYAAEVFETSEEILKAFGASRKVKRASGIYYTPSDVSDYLVDHVISLHRGTSGSPSHFTWLDPACGTGCFLRSVLLRAFENESPTTGEVALDYISEYLYGIDISPLALQSAAYLLILSCGEALSNLSLRECLFRIGRNLIVADSTAVQANNTLSTLAPKLASGADFVISNPPYVRKAFQQPTGQNSLFGGNKLESGEAQNIYTHFVRMLDSFTNPNTGVGGMVVPLSIAYNSRREFRSLRRFMRNRNKWWLAHFDRTPDSLFGDDVKTRNTVLFFARAIDEDKGIFTTDLIRWSSRSRPELFNNIAFSKVADKLNSDAIPKVGDDFGQTLLQLITADSDIQLGRAISRLRVKNASGGKALRSAATAYNWLPFEIADDKSQGNIKWDDTKYRYWRAKSDQETLAVFALVQSRLAYWLWRVWGDGFHLTDQFIASLPLSTSNLTNVALTRLSEIGDALWSEMLRFKVVSSNAGVSSISYCPYMSEELLDEIDRLIAQEYQLPAQTTSYLRDYVRRTVVAGRDTEITSNPALRKWMLKEERNERSLVGN